MLRTARTNPTCTRLICVFCLCVGTDFRTNRARLAFHRSDTRRRIGKYHTFTSETTLDIDEEKSYRHYLHFLRETRVDSAVERSAASLEKRRFQANSNLTPRFLNFAPSFQTAFTPRRRAPRPPQKIMFIWRKFASRRVQKRGANRRRTSASGLQVMWVYRSCHQIV